MSRRRLKIVLSYDGTKFLGWQIQRTGRTVQGVLEESLDKMHKHPVKVVAAGRTDSGVHSTGQVCHFDTDLDIQESNFSNAINSFLPNDIFVRKSCYVNTDFHARFSARKRVYKYYLVDYSGYNVFNRFYSTPVRNLSGLDLLNGCAQKIVGVHDFTT
ncbi:MAG: tRNA pseudouridine(38-40) synthase TruA, partial [Spirochaetales bacterium]|nr:tRNA pseudouridine(38-40) synthase TruA [Spirochaetales bacterium]